MEVAVAAHRYSRHSIWYFSLCIADSSNCSASRALIYRPAGPLSWPRGSELSFAYSHGTYSAFTSCTPFRRMHSPSSPSFPSSNVLSIGWLAVFSDPWHRHPLPTFPIPFPVGWLTATGQFIRWLLLCFISPLFCS